MKTLILSLVACFASAMAVAGTQTLPEPTLNQMLGGCTPLPGGGQYCLYPTTMTPNEVTTTYGHQAITGWSADGTQLYAAFQASVPHGCGGRGCIRYVYFCGTLTWTITLNPATGALNPIAEATWTPGSCAGADGPAFTPFPNAAIGGSAEVQVQQDEFSPTYYMDVATLLTP